MDLGVCSPIGIEGHDDLAVGRQQDLQVGEDLGPGRDAGNRDHGGAQAGGTQVGFKFAFDDPHACISHSGDRLGHMTVHAAARAKQPMIAA